MKTLGISLCFFFSLQTLALEKIRPLSKQEIPKIKNSVSQTLKTYFEASQQADMVLLEKAVTESFINDRGGKKAYQKKLLNSKPQNAKQFIKAEVKVRSAHSALGRYTTSENPERPSKWFMLQKINGVWKITDSSLDELD